MPADITRDARGLQQAVSELLEQSFAASRVARSLEDSDDEGIERMFGSLPPLTLSPGYYKQADYLVWLGKQKESGVIAGPFTLSEAEGLAAVAEARQQFERNHPPCYMCSALQDSPFATSCSKCGTELLRRSA